MATPDTLTLWLKEQALPIGLIALGILLAVLLLRVSARRRYSALMRERDGVTEQTFTAHLERYGFDRQITATTYRYLQETQRVQFPILPSDALDEDLGLDSEDIQQSVRDLTHKLHREPNLGLRSTPLTTVEDLVRLLQASPRKTRPAAAA
jgi:hypothetical protein